MDRGSSVIITELERELPRTVLTEGYRLPTIAKMLKSEDIFISRRGVAKFYQD